MTRAEVAGARGAGAAPEATAASIGRRSTQDGADGSISDNSMPRRVQPEAWTPGVPPYDQRQVGASAPGAPAADAPKGRVRGDTDAPTRRSTFEPPKRGALRKARRAATKPLSLKARIAGIGLIVVAVLCVATAGFVGVTFATGTPVDTPLGRWIPPIDEKKAAIAEDAAAEQQVAEQNGGVIPDPVPGEPLHLAIPAVGLDVDVLSMSVPESRELDPPGPYRAYWISDYGTAGAASTNTTYIAGHTYRDGSAVFNPLLDVPQSAGAVHAGDQIAVTTPEGEVDYTITSTELYDKVSVEQQDELWKQVPGRLVVVTCFQYNGGTSSSQNFVVYAQQNPAPPTPPAA
jgi:sortase (surface protein transpeptidase)